MITVTVMDLILGAGIMLLILVACVIAAWNAGHREGYTEYEETT